MQPSEEQRIITPELIGRFTAYLREQEKAPSTISQYTHTLTTLLSFLPGGAVTKTALIAWKEDLTGRFAAATVNASLAALNSFLSFSGWDSLKVKPLKIQRELFYQEDKELTRSEYVRLVQAAEAADNRRLSLVLQTICATGIRVSELQAITVEAVRCGRAEVDNKGKRRSVFLPDELRRVLKKYAGQQKRTAGPVFVTRTGKPLDRSNIWRDMKALCKSAGVAPGKVFPHNLRHLFARTYYTLEKDLSRLADLLGHTSVNTTRIYTKESGAVHARQIGRLGLVIT